MVKMVRDRDSLKGPRRMSSDEVARGRFIRRCDVKYWYLLGGLLACQLTIVVCYLEPSWLVVRVGRYSVVLGMWGYCLSVESFEECEYFYKVTPWRAQSTVLRLFQLLETIFVSLSVVSVLQLLCSGGVRRWQHSDTDVRSRQAATLFRDLLLVLSGVLGLGGAIAFYVSLNVYSTTNDQQVLQLLEERRAGWSLIVSIVAYCCRLVFSVLVVACRRSPPATDLHMLDEQLSPSMEEVKVNIQCEVVGGDTPGGAKPADGAGLGEYENMAADTNQTVVAGGRHLATSLDRQEEQSWMEAQLRKREEMEQMIRKKKDEETKRQRREGEALQKQQETKEKELLWGKLEDVEKNWEEMAATQNEDKRVLHTEKVEAKSKLNKGEEVLPERGVAQKDLKRQEDEERTLSKEERQNGGMGENMEQAGLAINVTGDRTKVKALIPESSGRETFKNRRKKRKFCCNS